MTRKGTTKLLIFSALLFTLASLTITFSSIFGIAELVYPVRVDSAYIASKQINLSKEVRLKDSLNPVMFLYKPEQLQLKYVNFPVKTSDGILLKGWYFASSTVETGITILLIHDINESKINYLEAAKAFTDRGFRVCCIDMRGCGESEGDYFTMGQLSAQDISIILDSLYGKPETNHVSIIGIGTGAAIAIQAVSIDHRPVSLIVQNGFASLTDYFNRYAIRKWGIAGKWFFPFMKKELDKQMGFNSDSLNLQVLIGQVSIPTLFIAKARDLIEDLKETHLLFERSGTSKKEFIFFSDDKEENYFEKNEKEYYDKISAFISTSIPQKSNQTRFRKFVLGS